MVQSRKTRPPSSTPILGRIGALLAAIVVGGALAAGCSRGSTTQLAPAGTEPIGTIAPVPGAGSVPPEVGDPTASADGSEPPAEADAADGGGDPSATATGPEVIAAAELAAVEAIDFDRLYRALDATREAAWDAEDPDALSQVSSNRQSIADLTAEAADTDTAWDTSGHTYEIHLVEVFEVVDDDTVLLYVEDSTTGPIIKRDTTGAVVDEIPARSVPRMGFVVWLERLDGGWKIARDYAVPVGFPRQPDAFAEVARQEIGPEEVTLRAAPIEGGFCFLVDLPGMPPRPQCRVFGAGSEITAEAQILVNRNDDTEAVVAWATEPGWLATLAVPAGVAAESVELAIDHPVGDLHVTMTVAPVGSYLGVSFTDPEPASDGTLVLDLTVYDLTSLRADDQAYWAGTRERS